jgi:hypothetical protein
MARIAQCRLEERTDAGLSYARASVRTPNTSSSRSASSALTGTAVTAIVSPTALKTQAYRACRDGYSWRVTGLLRVSHLPGVVFAFALF